ncbi:MAG: hypothetical protein E6J34_01035 [Chloroflexi bacterium]|nr:MAG: hypothetical protein E6J34_01035 [Chloroflexota bacterium]
MELWNGFDHQLQQANEQTRFGRAQRKRHMTEHAMLSSLREWLLSDYVAAYCHSLGATRIYRRCYWVDGLGIDAKANALPAALAEAAENNATTSPARRRKKNVQPTFVPPALQPIVTLAQAVKQSIALYGLILEAGSSKRKELRERITTPKEIAMPKEGGIVQASWLEAAPTLLKEIEQAPAIFLLAPFGPTLFTHDDLAQLYQRTVPTELCLFIPHKQITARLQAAQRIPAQATALTTLLRSDRWKTLLQQEESMEQAIAGVLELLIASMKRHFVLPIHRIALPMQTGPAQVAEGPYTLIFATRRQDSLLNMNDALCCHRQRLNTESHHGILGEEWFLTQQHERQAEALQELYQTILQTGKTQRIRRWPDLRQQVLLANFGQFITKDYDILMQQLLVNGEVRCEWRRPVREPQNQVTGEDSVQRVPGNDDLLVWM